MHVLLHALESLHAMHAQHMSEHAHAPSMHAGAHLQIYRRIRRHTCRPVQPLHANKTECMLHAACGMETGSHVCQDHSEPRSAVTFILRRCAVCCPAPCTIQSPASAAEPSTRPARGVPLHKQLRAQPGPDRVCAHAKHAYRAQVRSIRHTARQRPWPHRGRTRRLTRWTTP